jgi:hypothetical protein
VHIKDQEYKIHKIIIKLNQELNFMMINQDIIIKVEILVLMIITIIIIIYLKLSTINIEIFLTS